MTVCDGEGSGRGWKGGGGLGKRQSGDVMVMEGVNVV